MCGIFGIIDKKPIAESIYHGLIQLQHRGQDAAGIFTYDLKTDKHAIHKDLGLVCDVFNSDTLPLPNACWGIGHVRYTTIGSGTARDTQPFYVHGKHMIGMAHNGNVVNYLPLRKELEEQGTIFESTCDLEVILHLFSNHLPSEEITFSDICHAVKVIHEKVQGAYSVIGIIGGVGLFAFRDPWGIRPLLIGYSKEEPAYVVGSETNALSVFGCQDISDIRAGEVVVIDKDLEMYRHEVSYRRPAHCSFEYDYFSKPNSIIEQQEVATVRGRLGTALAERIRKSGIEIDVIVPIPTTARTAAIALAKELSVDYQEGFVKQDNIGRTFIMPTQGVRQKALLRKLAPIRSVFNNKKVLLVDDSIVRGTVSRRVISLARWAGAEQVYFASTFPPIRYPCLYGIDFPRADQLIATERSLTQVQSEIGSDALFYNEVKTFKEAVGTENLCLACLTGHYPTGVQGMDELQKLRAKDLAEVELAHGKL